MTNSFGLIDTIGNVWEWCSDGYRWGYDSGPEDQRPRQGDKSHELDLYRGGCWYSDKEKSRSAYREAIKLSFEGGGAGFRVSRSLD